MTSRRAPVPRVRLDDDYSDDGEADRTPSPDPDVVSFLEAQRNKKADDPDMERRKLARFQGGAVTKSKYQREKEEAEKRRKVEESEAAKAYQDFLEDMDTPRRRGTGDGQRGESSTSSYQGSFVSAGGTKAYAPSRPPVEPKVPTRSQSDTTHNTLTKLTAFGDDADDDEIARPPPRREPPGKRKRAMDDFLGELQRTQAAREERYKDRVPPGGSVSSMLAFEGVPQGSRVMDDTETTNIAVLNLPANVEEMALGTFFAQWGDIATVKIMWPRGDDAGTTGGMMTQHRLSRSGQGLVGFVSFMTRSDAEVAFSEADGIEWGGSVIRTSWGKIMPKPFRAMYARQSASRHGSGAGTSGGGGGDRRRSPNASPQGRRSHRAPSDSGAVAELRKRVTKAVEEREEDLPPGGQTLASTIKAVADKVSRFGKEFENVVKSKEAENDRFKFLSDEKSIEHQYYRLCLDPNYVPDLDSEPFADDGLDSLYSTDSEEYSENERLKKRKSSTIGPVARRRLEAMLRGLTPRRERIARCMAFCIRHASAADTISDLLIQSLLLPRTPIPRKIARLHVVSDVLHNSAASAPNAWRYRNALENRLDVALAHLGDVVRSFPGRIKAESVRVQVRAVVECWEDWLVLPPATIERLKKAFEGAATGGGGGGGGGGGVPPVEEQDGEAMDLDGEELS